MKFIKIKEFPKYEISDMGVIRHIESKRIKSQYVSSTGYYMVSFYGGNNKSKPQRVHRLLAKVFIPNPKKHPFINHIDGNKLNNKLNNLEWCTNSHNIEHAFRMGLINNTGVNNGMSKLNDIKAKEIKTLLNKGYSQYRIARLYKVSRSAILKIKLNLTWKHV
jgi:hypothetical protein